MGIFDEYRKKKTERIALTSNPPSKKQIETIDDLKKVLYDAEINFTDIDIKDLDGGENGTASEYIKELQSLENIYPDKFPPTKIQLDMLYDMFYLPDINFEEFGVVSEFKVFNPLKEEAYRVANKDELVEQFKEIFTRETAGDLIQLNKKAYYDWKRDRITSKQIETIHLMEEFLGTLVQRKEGIIIGNLPKNLPTNKRKLQDPKGKYLTPIHILQMYDKRMANKLIKSLKRDIDNRDYSRYEPNSIKNELFERIKEDFAIRTKDPSEKDKELLNVIYGIEMRAGSESYEDLDQIKQEEILDYLIEIITSFRMPYKDIEKSLESYAIERYLDNDTLIDDLKYNLLKNKKFLERILYKY